MHACPCTHRHRIVRDDAGVAQRSVVDIKLCVVIVPQQLLVHLGDAIHGGWAADGEVGGVKARRGWAKDGNGGWRVDAEFVQRSKLQHILDALGVDAQRQGGVALANGCVARNDRNCRYDNDNDKK